MNNNQIALYWTKFFADLFLGTGKNLGLFSGVGWVVGVLAATCLGPGKTEAQNWNFFAEWATFIFTFLWFLLFGCFHGILTSLFITSQKKLTEAVLGMHDLLDLLSKQVLERIPKFSNKVPKEELAQKFDSIGQEFLEKLKLKKGIIYFPVLITYAIILKILKYLFINDVVEELRKKQGDHLTSADIESALRRVGVERILSPIDDYFMLTHFLNLVLFLITFGLPFALFYWVI